MNTTYRLLRDELYEKEGYLAHYLHILGRIDRLGEKATEEYIASSPEATQKNFRGIAFVTFRTQAIRNLVLA